MGECRGEHVPIPIGEGAGVWREVGAVTKGFSRAVISFETGSAQQNGLLLDHGQAPGFLVAARPHSQKVDAARKITAQQV